MATAPALSVVIATFNRCDTLRITLEKLTKQSIYHSDFEVLVVDDGSPDDTQKMMAAFVSSSPYELRYFRHKNRGPGYTQNRGIKEARSDLVLLMADDIWASEQLLEQHFKMHREYPAENIAVLGKVLQSKELPTTVMHKYWDPFMYYRFEGKRELDSIFFFACNISVKKNFLISNGLYKESRCAAHEDIELGYRLRQKGLRTIYSEHALAYHYHPETLTSACRRAYERGLNFDMLSENIPKSFIFPLYHYCSLQAGLKAFMQMLPREVGRKFLFNKFSVDHFWLPILQSAETNRIARLFANGITFRGTIHYHMRKGYKALKNKQRTNTIGTIAENVIEES